VVCVDCGCDACAGAGCGRCDFCLRGETNRCSRLVRIGFERSGGMAEYVNGPAGNLEKIADHISFEQAAIVPDAVVSMYRGLKTLGGVTAGSKLAIAGVGGLGMQGIRIAKLLGAHITCTSRNDEKLALAKSIGADRTVNTRKEKFLDVAKAIGGFDVVADLIGTRDSLMEAVSACRNGGRVVALAYVDPTMEIPSYDIVIKEKQVVGSRASTRSEFREVMNLVNNGKIVPHIGKRVPIRDVNEALENLRNGKYFTRTVLMLPF
jgi:propanol-preferring alcohol dehydrogenase